MTSSPSWFDTLATSEGFDPNTEWLGDPAAELAAAGESMNYGAGMGMGMDLAAGGGGGIAGGPGGGALKTLASRTLPGSFGVRRFMGKGLGAERVPGPFVQTPPRSNVGLGFGEDTGVPTPLNQVAALRPVTVPTGSEWPAGAVVKNRYPKLNRLMNQAQGIV